MLNFKLKTIIRIFKIITLHTNDLKIIMFKKVFKHDSRKYEIKNLLWSVEYE